MALPSEIVKSRAGVSAAFALNGLVVSTWVSRIPAIQGELALSPGVLGMVLLAPAAGSVVAMPATGWFIARRGSRRIVRISGPLFCCSLLPIALAGNAWELAAALFLFGATGGALNVSMNTHAVSVEETWERPLMGSFHACWSLGAMTGSALGGWVAGLAVAPLLHFSSAALIFLLVMTLAAVVLHRPDHVSQPSGVSLRIPRAVAGLGVIAFAISIAEGAMADWTAVYLDSILRSGAAMAAMGFSCYAAAMIVARLAADRLTSYLGRPRLIRTGSLVAFSGLALALLARGPAPALAGFAIVGLGVAAIIPNVFGAAGRVPSLPPGVGMAAVTTAAYMGFFGGPPVIGGLAEWFGLRAALGIVLVCLAVAAALAKAVR